MCEANYLVGLPTDTINKYGLSKTLLTRRETIYLKHIMKNIFIYGNEEELNEKIRKLQFKSQFQYMKYLTDRLRGIYKLPRSFRVDSADDFVKNQRNNLIPVLQNYKQLNPIIIIDFDRTITNKRFHSLYKYLLDNKFRIIINSANPSEETICNYLIKYGLPFPQSIYANKGKKNKITKLKDIAMKHTRRIMFYIDDELEYLEYGCLLGMYCYEYSKNGKIHARTIFQR